MSKRGSKSLQDDSELEAQTANPVVTVAALSPTLSGKEKPSSQPENDGDRGTPPRNASFMRTYFSDMYRWGPMLWCLQGAIAIGIPLAVYMTIHKSSTTGHIPTGSLLLFLFVAWCSLYLTNGILGIINVLFLLGFNPLEDPFNAARSMIIQDVHGSLLTFLTLAIIYGASEKCLCLHYEGECHMTWVDDFRKALLATFILAAVWFVKTLILEGIYLRNGRAFLDSRSLRPMRAWRSLLESLQKMEEQRFKRLLSNWGVMSEEAKTTDRLLAHYISGKGEEEFYENINFLQHALAEWNEGIDGKEIDLDEIKKAIVHRNSEARHYDGDAFADDEQDMEDFRILFDTDGDGRVTLEECYRIYLTEIVPFFRDCNKSVFGIRAVINEVNKVLIIVFVPLAAIVYAAFFLHDFSQYATPLWTTLTGLSFAISGTVTSFIAACSFVFGKQPYDVGDRVGINIDGKDQDLIVLKIRLHYSKFRRLGDSTILQVGHETLDTLWISNLSRSTDLHPAEERDVPVDGQRLIQNLDAWQTALRERVKLDTECQRHLDTDALTLTRPPQKDDDGYLCRVALGFTYRKRMIMREEHLAVCRETVWRELRKIMDDDDDDDDDHTVQKPYFES